MQSVLYRGINFHQYLTLRMDKRVKYDIWQRGMGYILDVNYNIFQEKY